MALAGKNRAEQEGSGDARFVPTKGVHGELPMTDTLALCYHAVSPGWQASLSVTPEALESQLRRLSERGYRGVTYSEAVLGEPGGGRRLAVTFDDAYRSVIDLALPILDRLGLVATVFAPTAFIDSPLPMSWDGIDQWIGGPHEAELRCMDGGQLRELSDRGWEIGSHTDTHPHLPLLAADDLAHELLVSRRKLEELLGHPCTSIAYPYGEAGTAVAEAAGAAGYRAAATLDVKGHDGDALQSPRVGIYHSDAWWRAAAKTLPLVRKGGLARVRHPLTYLARDR